MTARSEVPRAPELTFGDFADGHRGHVRPVRPGWSQAETDDTDDDVAPSAVRPYTWTRGRTTTEFRFPMETLLSTTSAYREYDDTISSEFHAVASLCRGPRSVAEVAALLRIPLGVAR